MAAAPQPTPKTKTTSSVSGAGAPVNLQMAPPPPPIGPGGAAGGGAGLSGANYPPGYSIPGTSSAQPGTTTSGSKGTTPKNRFANMTDAQIAAWIQAQAAALAAGGVGAGSSGASAAADLAERRREFDVTTQRDIAKENASEVDALQKMISGMSGPKDVYGDLFFSHGLQPPQGYKPAPLPLTQAQIGAYKAMGVSPQQLQTMLTGNGKPGADAGMLGNLGSSLQPQAGTPGFQPAQAPTGAQQSANPTAQGGALYGRNPAGTSITNMTPQTPGGVPSMAVGGIVPEENEARPQQGPSSGGLKSMLPPGLHPAIANLVDAVSNLLSNPDFRPFVEDAAPPHGGGAPVLAMLHGGEEVTPADEVEEGPERPDSPQTPGGVQSMAVGGAVNPSATRTSSTSTASAANPKPSPFGANNAPPIPGMTPPSGNGGFTGPPTPIGTSPLPASSGGTSSGLQPGAQGVISNAGWPLPKDNPILPLSNMDPYTRALYDIHGRLHPYSAQQEMQMGPQGVGAVNSYIGKVEGGDVDAYTDLVNRLKPTNGAPQAGDVQGDAFTTG